MPIFYVKNKDIDFQKWDKLIDESHNGNIYGYSWILNIMASNWDALVLDDYEAILPIPFNRKKIIKQVYQPMFLQRFAIYSREKLHIELKQEFLKKLNQRFKIIYLNLDEEINTDLGVTRRTNQIIDLSIGKEEIYKNYHKNKRNGINRAREAKLHMTPYITPDQLCEIYNKNVAPKLNYYPQSLDEKIQKVIIECLKRRKGIILGVEKGKGNLLGGAFIFDSHNRLIHPYTAFNIQGRENNGNTFMKNEIIMEYAGSDKIYDFMGSSIKGVAAFNKEFGATEENYYTYSKDESPGLLSKIRKIFNR